MCGIAGFFGEIARSQDAASRLTAMSAALAHRGPDGQGCWLGPDVGLGHTRLAIIDLDGGAQPMWNDGRTHVIVFNGEIYNHAKIRSRLVTRGYRFTTRSDTEVIWAAIDAWGIEEALLELRGMFAFALYDTHRRSLLLARDRVGIKPLFVARFRGGLAFASEPKALLTIPEVPRRLNPAGIHDYLATGYATSPGTCWADIETVEPGCWLRLGPAGEQAGRYWKWTPREQNNIGIGAAAQRVDTVLREAVRSHLLADVPVGTFLSGGLDSSLITALLTDREERTRTFSVGFGDSEYDETPYARSVAQRFDTEHHDLQIPSGEGSPELFRKIVEQYDEPFGDSSCIPVWLICREVRKNLKVVLSGDGGDEILGGYTRYSRARQLASLARCLPLIEPVAGMLRRRRTGRSGYRISKALLFAHMPVPERLCAMQSYFLEDQRQSMYQPEFARLTAAAGATGDRLRPFVPDNVTDPVQQMIAAEMALRLHADYLRKVDVASSAHGLEVRVPYLDAAMLDLGAELPVRFKVGACGRTKILSRRLARKYLPAGISGRRKQGFSIPLDRWAGPGMRAFFKDLLLDPGARCKSFLRPASVTEVWNAFDTPDLSGLSRYQRYQRLFLFVSLELWLRRWSPALP